MSLESMLANLEQEAQAEKKKISEDAQLQIQQIRKESEERSKVIQGDLMIKAKELADIEEAKHLGQTRAQANRLLLEARQKEIEKIFNEAKESIRRLPKEADYPQLLSSLIQEALGSISGKVIAEVSSQDIKLAHEYLKRFKREAEVKTNPEIQGGVILKTPDQRLTIENTLESRLSKAFGTLRAEVAQKLWPQKTAVSGQRSGDTQ